MKSIKHAIIKELVENFCWDLERNVPSITKKGNKYIIKSVGVWRDNVDEFYYDSNDGHFYLDTLVCLKKYSYYPKLFDGKGTLVRR